MTEALSRDQRKLMNGNHERTKSAWYLLRALLCLRVRVRGCETQRPRRCCRHAQLRTASDTSIRIAIPTEATEGICGRIDHAGEVEDDHFLKTRVEVSSGGPQSVTVEHLVNTRIKGNRAVRPPARIAKDREAEASGKRTETCDERWSAVTVTGVRAPLFA